MTITALKIIALILMTIDHIGDMIFPDVIWLRYIGRLSAPIFIFCVTEAMKNTHNQKKYLIKLFGFSLITTFFLYMTMLINFCMTGQLHVITLNVTGLLFQGALFIYVIEAVRQKKNKWQLLVVIYVVYQIIMRLLHPLLVQVDFGYEIWFAGPLSCINTHGICWIALFPVFYYSKKKIAVNYIIYCVIYWYIRVSYIFARIGVRLQFYEGEFQSVVFKIVSRIYQFIFRGILGLNTQMAGKFDFRDCQWLMVFSIIFIIFYNGKYGKGMKKLFYVYYPLHIIILYFIRELWVV